MAITSGDGYVAAAKEKLPYFKTQTATTVAAQWHTLLDRSGNPGAGSLAVGNTTTGLVPTDATAGFPPLVAFGGGNTGYLTGVSFSNDRACRFAIYDRLFHAGSVSMTTLATTSFSTQPSFLGRVPNGTGAGCEIWLEINAAVSATATTINVTYTNEAGTPDKTTGATATLSGFVTGRLIKMPLAAGDKGVSLIKNVIVGGTVATTGTFNVIVARPLVGAGLRVAVAGAGDVLGLDRTGMPIVYDSSALWPIIAADSTSSGIPDLMLEVANG